MAANQQDMIEELFKSIDIIVDSRIDSLEFDKTITCSITDTTYANRGEYTVTDGTTVFQAYSENKEYIVGQYVYVQIPNGDFNKKKLITGRYVEDNSPYYTYKPPLNNFIDITHNLLDADKDKTADSILANGSYDTKLIWQKDNVSYVDYNRIGLRAGFKTWLTQYNLARGNYGLALYVVGRTETSDELQKYSCVLDTNDFYGSVYNYETYYNQEKLFDVSGLKEIVSLRLYFFQDNNFYEGNGNRIPSKDTQGKDLPDNIFVNNIYVSLGYDLNKFDSDTVLLYTTDKSTYQAFITKEQKEEKIAALDSTKFENTEKYDQAVHNILYDAETATKLLKEYNKRLLQMRWIHFNDESDTDTDDAGATSLDSNNMLPSDAIVHWYKYQLIEGLKDALAGAFWKEVKTPKDNLFEYRYFVPDESERHEMLKVIIEYPSRESICEKIYNDNIIPNISTKPTNKTFYDFIQSEKEKIQKEVDYNKNIIDNVDDAQEEAYAKLNSLCESEKVGKTEEQQAEIDKEYSEKADNLIDDCQDRYNELRLIQDKITAYESEIHYYESAVLELKNETNVPDKTTVDLISGLDITCDSDGLKGCYRIYDANGDIISGAEAIKERLLTATYQSLVTGDTLLDSAEKISWYFPINNTMIEYPKKEVEFSNYIKTNVTPSEYNRKDKTYYVKAGNNEYYVSTGAYDNDTTYYLLDGNITTSVTDDGYFCICRNDVSLKANAGDEQSKNASQVFRIKSYYSQNLTNNTIKCVIQKNGKDYEKDISLVFGPTGTNGTTYTLVLEMDDKKPAITASSNENDALTIIPHLYDYENKDVTTTILSDESRKITYEWYSMNKSGALTIGVPNQKTGVVKLFGTSDDLNDYRYYILKCSIPNVTEIVPNQGISLTAYLPIPVRVSDIYIAFDGATKIVYDAQGGKPQFYKDGYKIYKYDSNTKTNVQIVNKSNDESKFIVKWKMSLGDDTEGVTATDLGTIEEVSQYYPSVSLGGILSAPAMYMENNGRQVCVDCYYNGEFVWTQPLYIYQDSYSSSLLNSWDGNLTMDQKNGTILSTMVGAGKKDALNRFNGVLMGDISAAQNTRDIGLYGYHEGVQSFGFNIKGTAFLGKSGKGQIKFDGNKGIIESGNFSDYGGIKLDLDDGFIDMRGRRYTNARYFYNGSEVDLIGAARGQLRYYQGLIDKLNAKKQQCDSIIDERKNLRDKYNRDKAKVLGKKQTLERQRDELIEAKNLLEVQRKKANDDIKTDKEEIEKLNKTINELKANKTMTSSQRMKKISEANTQKKKYKADVETNKTLVSKLDHDISGYTQTITKLEIFEIKACNDKITTLDEEIRKCETTGEEIESFNKIKSSADVEINKYNKLINNLQHLLVKKDDDTDYRLPTRNDMTGKTNDIKDEQLEEATSDVISYVKTYGEPAVTMKIDKNVTSRVKISTKNPYFYIDSSDGNKLIYIGDNKYYLQTNNYQEDKATKDDEDDSNGSMNSGYTVGSGFKLDLRSGTIDTYNLKFRAYNSNINSKFRGSYLTITSSGKPFITVHHKQTENGRVIYDLDVLKITNDKFIMQSHNWNTTNETGLSLNLTTGNLTAYNNFTMYAKKGNTFIRFSNNDPYFVVHTESQAQNLIQIGSDTWTMYSQNWNVDSNDVSKNAGINFDMMSGRITAYDFNLSAYHVFKDNNNENKVYNIVINNTVKTSDEEQGVKATPLVIGQKGKEAFKVTWNGRVTANYIIIKDGGEIGPFTICSESLYTGQNVFETAIESNTSTNIYLGTKGFCVSGDRFIVRSSVDISDPIKKYTLTVNGRSHLAGAVDISGPLTTSGTITITSGSLISGGNATSTFNGTVYINGDCVVAGTIKADNNNWSSSGNGSGGGQILNGTGGSVGGMSVGSGIGSDSIHMDNDVIKVGSITLDGKSNTITVGDTVLSVTSDATKLNLGGVTLTGYNSLLTIGGGIQVDKTAVIKETLSVGISATGTVFTVSGDATISGGLTAGTSTTSITFNAPLKFGGAGKIDKVLKVNLPAGGEVTYDGSADVNVYSRYLEITGKGNVKHQYTIVSNSKGTCDITNAFGKLAFVDDIKKKFSLNKVKLNVYYKLTQPAATTVTLNYTQEGSSAHIPVTCGDRYIYSHTVHLWSKSPIVSNTSGVAPDSSYTGHTWYSVYRKENWTVYVYAHLNGGGTASVELFSKAKTGWTAKVLEFNKTGNVDVPFEASSTTSDRITLTESDF